MLRRGNPNSVDPSDEVEEAGSIAEAAVKWIVGHR
jgi:hypothetical protein